MALGRWQSRRDYADDCGRRTGPQELQEPDASHGRRTALWFRSPGRGRIRVGSGSPRWACGEVVAEATGSPKRIRQAERSAWRIYALGQRPVCVSDLLPTGNPDSVRCSKGAENSPKLECAMVSQLMTRARTGSILQLRTRQG